MKMVIIQTNEPDSFFMKNIWACLQRKKLAEVTFLKEDANINEFEFNIALLPIKVRNNIKLKEQLSSKNSKIILYDVVESLMSFESISGDFILHNASIERQGSIDNQFLYMNDFNSEKAGIAIGNLLC